MSEPSPLKFQCDHCGRRFTWKPELIGKRAKCPCGNALTVPAEPAGAAPVAAAVEPPPLPTMPPPPPPIPVPVMTMPYQPVHPGRAGKPAGLITLGICSIIVGLLSMAASGYSANLWWTWSAGSTPPAVAAPTSGPPLPPTSFRPYQPGSVRATGLPADARAKILSTVQLTGYHAADRRKLLDTVLAEFGADLMKGQDATALVKQPIVGRQKEDDQTMPAQQVTFRAPGGRVTLFTNRATVEAFNSFTTTVTNDRFERRGEPTHYTRSAIDAGVAKLRSESPAVTDAQIGFVADKADTATSVGMLEHEMIFARPVIQKVVLNPPPAGNVLDVVVGREEYFVLPDGRGDRKLAAQYGLDPATGGPVIPVTPFRPMYPGSPRLMRWMAIYCGAVVALAVFLIAAGALTIAKPLTGGPLLLVYAVLKLVCIATEVWLSFAFFNSIAANTSSMRSFDPETGRAAVYTTVVVQLVLPLAILIVYAATGESRRRYAAERSVI